MSERRAVPDATRQAQALASDPSLSAWVSANAGSGKTHVLAQRVIRLLLAGAEPARILCLTFTRAAAAEMANRIFKRLADWAVKPDAALRDDLTDVLGRRPERRETERARILFALSLDTPGGLRVQTIHAFCEALLHQFPLEANVSGHFSVISDEERARLLEESRRQVVLETEGIGAAEPDPQLRAALATILDEASDQAFEDALKHLIGRRHSFLAWAGQGLDLAMAPAFRRHGLAPGDTPDAALAQAGAGFPLDAAELRQVAEIVRTHGSAKQDAVRVERIERALAATDPLEGTRLRLDIWRNKDGGIPKALFTKGAMAALGPLASKVEAVTAWIEATTARQAAARVLSASHALFVFAQAVLQRYAGLKRRRGLVDYDDLIQDAAHLLTRSEVRQWVQYKLDRGVDHVLVDEAQDTSGLQWQIINALTGEFHAGAGAGEGKARTVFAVGDEKQSIFSFQGADPSRFAAEGEALARRAGKAGLPFSRVPLRLSFRSAPDILAAVDTVFADPARRRGLNALDEAPVHEAIRLGAAGEVHLWPLYGKEPTEKEEDWAALLEREAAAEDPARALARRIAATLRGWVDTGLEIGGRHRRVRPGEVMILIRKRDRFSAALLRELKQRGLPMAGADRLRLTDHIAVEDLLALGRFALMPEDDLSLAGVLKSPLFGCSDDDLIAWCPHRKGQPLIERLRELAASGDERLAALGERLDRVLRLARTCATPYRFYAEVLGREGGRAALLAALGREAEEVLDAFEEAAMEHGAAGAGLEDFIAGLTGLSPEIKRESGVARDEIRVMTVHGAKGLEASVVFVVDPCTDPFGRSLAPGVVTGGSADAPVWLWRGFDSRAAGRLPEVDGAMSALEAQAEEEYRRLLYVAMTRAKDLLVMCGWATSKPTDKPHWHALVTEALMGGHAGDLAHLDAYVWRRTGAPPDREDEPPAPADPQPAGADRAALPGWLTAPAPREPAVPRPLTPSGAVALLPGAASVALAEAGEARAEEASSELVMAGARREAGLDKGVVVHRLLQFLPQIEPAGRAAFAARWLERNALHWPEAAVDAALGEVEATLADPRLATLFGPRSRAEASLTGLVTLGGEDILVAGQIDRLLIEDDRIEVLDYKTNRQVPASAADVPESYVVQLGLYRALLAEIHPGRPIACHLLYTREGRLLTIPAEAMDAALARLRP